MTERLELRHLSVYTEAYKIKEKEMLFSEEKYFKKVRKAHAIVGNVYKSLF